MWAHTTGTLRRPRPCRRDCCLSRRRASVLTSSSALRRGRKRRRSPRRGPASRGRSRRSADKRKARRPRPRPRPHVRALDADQDDRAYASALILERDEHERLRRPVGCVVLARERVTSWAVRRADVPGLGLEAGRAGACQRPAARPVRGKCGGHAASQSGQNSRGASTCRPSACAAEKSRRSALVTRPSGRRSRSARTH
jgi:hypothetical protein